MLLFNVKQLYFRDCKFDLGLDNSRHFVIKLLSVALL